MKTTSRTWILVLCWLTVMFEGFDIVALGATIPILTDPVKGHLGVTVTDLTFVSTISLVGVGIGASVIGPIADRFGRRGPLIACIAVFSICTILFPLMPNVGLMGLMRLVAGLGLGGCMPVALTMMQEAAPGGRKGHATTLTMTGYHAGAVLASLSALWAQEHWALLFYVGGALGLLTLPFVFAKLPETHTPHALRANPGPRYGIRDLFTSGRARITLGLWAGAFMGLLLVYGLNTWMPKIMAEAGYNVSSSIVMLFVLNLGAIIGLLIGGRLGDAKGMKGTTMIWFAGAAVLLATLSIKMDDVLVLNSVILVTGVFVFCAQVLVYGFVGYLYPRRMVATAMGFTAGVGRLGAIVGPWVTGMLVAADLAYPFGFYFFAIVAGIAFAAMASIPRPKATTATALDQAQQDEDAAERARGSRTAR